MKITHQTRFFTLKIDVFDDPSFTQSAAEATAYDKVYMAETDRGYEPNSQHAIVVYRDHVKTASAMLLSTAGATTVTPDSVLIDNHHIITRCGNTVFCLDLLNLDLQWMVEADWATCFSIHLYQNSYITHGETSITRIHREGSVLWSYSGADIFVRLDGGPAFIMHDAYIELNDFNGGHYTMDYDGNAISYTP